MKKQRGITLIALVVTIIVLIILAGISINLILGENGIITRASGAKQENIKAEERESIGFAYQNAEMELVLKGKEITAETIGEELKKYDKNVTVEEIEKSEIGDLEVVVDSKNATGYAEITFGKTENKYVVALKGTVTEEETPTLSLTYDPPLSQYTNGTVTVTANTNTSKYTVEMSTDGTSWDSVNSLTYDTNGKVYARLTDGKTELEGEVTNIDKNAPTVELEDIDYDNAKIILSNVTAEDYPINIICKITNYSGENEFTQTITEGTSATLNVTKAFEDDEYYEVQIKAIDAAGNEGTYTATGNVCFVAGTKVSTEEGLKNIEDIKIGEKVYTRNIEKGTIELKEVTTVHQNKATQMCKVYVEDVVITSTSGHEYYVVGKGWVGAKDLKEGDKLLDREGGKTTVTKIEVLTLEEPVEVYNLTIKDYHNYLITEHELLVHNANDCY